jgi:hypothetical protein
MKLFTLACCAVFSLAAPAQTPLPDLKIEAINAGSAFLIRNPASQPLTAFLIELVDYPGSYFALYEDRSARVILEPGAAIRMPITNMTVGAAPEYVKMQAAIYQDGSTAGAPEKVAQLVGRRRHILSITRELIARLEKGQTAAGLKQWAGSIPEPTRGNRATPAAANDLAAKALILETAARIERESPAAALAALKKSEASLAASKPAL